MFTIKLYCSFEPNIYIYSMDFLGNVIKEPQCPSRCPVRTIKQDMSVQSVYIINRGGGGGEELEDFGCIKIRFT